MKEEKNTHDGDNKRNSDEINKLKETANAKYRFFQRIKKRSGV